MGKEKRCILTIILSVIILIVVACSSNPFNSNDLAIKGHITILNSEIDDQKFDIASPSSESRASFAVLDSKNEEEYVEDEIIVSFKDSAQVNNLLDKYDLLIKSEIDSLGAKLLRVEGDDYVLKDLISKLNSEPGVEYAELNYIAQINIEEKHPQNEDYYTQQWSYSAISLPYAWTITTGSEEVVVAVLDTGVDKDHPDLKEQITIGRNFSRNGNEDEPYDSNGHGTHVAGTIGAAANEGGVVGVSWQVQIMPVKVLGDDGGGNTFAIAEGIDWARNNGANIINMSLGSGILPSRTIEEAINIAYNAGITIVAAAGNDEIPEISYPARYENVIAVGAVEYNSVDNGFKLADFNDDEGSNYGREIDFVAPGRDIVSTWINNSYIIASGTSMAAPHVSGLAALILAENPGLSPQQVKERLSLTAQNLGERGWNFKYGYGLINAYAAVADLRIDKAVVFAAQKNGDQLQLLSEMAKVNKSGFYELEELDGSYYLYAWIDKKGNGIVSEGDYFARSSSPLSSGLNANLNLELRKAGEEELGILKDDR